MIDRRSVAGGAALLWLLARHPAQAQRANRLPRVARISTEVPLANLQGLDPIDRGWRAFVHGMRDLGWVDGRNLVIEHRSAEGHPERLPALLRELVELPVDVIVTTGTAMARAARQATDTIPIVAVGPDLVSLGLASSLARPGGNVTGLTFQSGAALSTKRLELIKRAVPAARRIALMIARPLPGQPPWSQEVGEAARALGLELSFVAIDNSGDLDSAFAELARMRPDGILGAASPVIIGHRERITAFAAKQRLPSIFALRQFAEAGALMSYGPNLVDAERRAATYVDKILKGAKPAEMPIDQPTRFEFVINQKTASALGIKLPKALLLQADEVIR